MKISKKGLELIKEFEGFESKPYLCSAKVPTIGYGTTVYPNGVRVTLSDNPIEEATALEYLGHYVNRLEPKLNALITSKLNQNQWDAIYSFTYNLGITNFASSTLLKKINRNPKDFSIRTEFMKWVNAGGVPRTGLIRRRKAEQLLYFDGL